MVSVSSQGDCSPQQPASHPLCLALTALLTVCGLLSPRSLGPVFFKPRQAHRTQWNVTTYQFLLGTGGHSWVPLLFSLGSSASPQRFCSFLLTPSSPSKSNIFFLFDSETSQISEMGVSLFLIVSSSLSTELFLS